MPHYKGRKDRRRTASFGGKQVVETRHFAWYPEGIVNSRSTRPPGIYVDQIARFTGTQSRKVENVCRRLGIERWSFGQLGRAGQSVPLSIEQTIQVLRVIREMQGFEILGRQG